MTSLFNVSRFYLPLCWKGRHCETPSPHPTSDGRTSSSSAPSRDSGAITNKQSQSILTTANFKRPHTTVSVKTGGRTSLAREDARWLGCQPPVGNGEYLLPQHCLSSGKLKLICRSRPQSSMDLISPGTTSCHYPRENWIKWKEFVSPRLDTSLDTLPSCAL